VCKIKGIHPETKIESSMDCSRLRHGLASARVLLLFLLPVSLFAFQDQKENPNPLQPQAPANPAPMQPKPIQPNEGGPSGNAGGAMVGGAPVDSNKYKIGPNDVLLIRVWAEPEFSGPVAVHQDGRFTLPLVGDLEAGGKTPNEVQDIVATALKKYVNKPLVTITVQEVGSKRYFMDGMIARPGEYALVTPTTVLEAISRAGGVGEFANQKKIYVLRGSKRIYFNYHDVLRGKHMDQNIAIEPGDHIVVP